MLIIFVQTPQSMKRLPTTPPLTLKMTEEKRKIQIWSKVKNTGKNTVFLLILIFSESDCVRVFFFYVFA